jgi:transcriptional regulator with XRE-family HTH domain
MPESPPGSFGGLLRSLRTTAGLTQEELAEAARVSYRSISDLERGVSRSPRRDTARLLADALGLSGDDRAGFEAAARGRFVGRDLRIHQASSSSVPAKRKIWGNVPARNPGFTGRGSRLTAIRDALASGDRAVVQALHGMGGVGKTQLAIEYAHRHEGDYEVIWWLNSETKTLLGEGFAALAAELSCAAPGATLDVMRRAVLAALHERDHWLLIFDNAVGTEGIADWLPSGNGHVLITSRASNWHDLAVPVEVDVFTRFESVGALCRRVPDLSRDDAAHVAEAVGDLPLAVAQAASYMALTGIPPDEYTRLLEDRPTEILDHGKPWSYPRSLAAATILSFDQLRTEDPAAAEAAAICAFLAPEPVPAEWFPHAAEHLPDPLGERAADAIAWRQVVAHLRGSAIARLNAGTLLMHRLTLAIIRDYLPPGQAQVARGAAVGVVIANRPGGEDLPAAWPAWATMLPHVLALDPANSDDADLRNLAAHAIIYLVWRADPRAAIDLARYLHGQWRVNLGEDHPDTLRSANGLAMALYHLGEYRAARDLHEDVLARSRRVLGEDHPDTLWFATLMARDLHGLGEFGTTRDLGEDVLERYRRVLGEDHPGTFWSASELARDLRGLGEYRAARDLEEDVLARRRRVLGENHPTTLWSANGLASALRGLGEYRAARDLGEDVLERYRRVLGEDHLDTLISASNLAEVLYELGIWGRPEIWIGIHWRDTAGHWARNIPTR